MTNLQEWTLVGGIDPGTKYLGVCVVGVKGQDLQLVHVSALKVRGDTIEQRVAFVGFELARTLPSGLKLIAVEGGYVGRGARAALTVAMARGVAVYGASEVCPNVALVQPGEARKAAGAALYGAKRKVANERVQRVVTRIFGRETMLTEDEAAAGALAIWAANRVWQYEPGMKRGL